MYKKLSPMFTKEMLGKVSPPFKMVLLDIQKQVIFRALQIYTELGSYSFSQFFEKVAISLEDYKLNIKFDIDVLKEIRDIINKYE